MSVERFGGIRISIAAEAARIMYEEQVKEYFTAKRIAAKPLLGHGGMRACRYRPRDLPSNGEIRDALLALADTVEGERRQHYLFAMRIVALETMVALEAFSPRLIGSVATGHIRNGSDIDIQVFTDAPEELELHMSGLRWVFDRQVTSIYKFGKIRDYVHYYVTDNFQIELTAYERRELRFRPKSSTDGKPIERVSAKALRTLLERDHPEEWRRYLEDGTVVGLDEVLEEEGEVDEEELDGEELEYLGEDEVGAGS